jgi:hypothetical protein
MVGVWYTWSGTAKDWLLTLRKGSINSKEDSSLILGNETATFVFDDILEKISAGSEFFNPASTAVSEPDLVGTITSIRILSPCAKYKYISSDYL